MNNYDEMRHQLERGGLQFRFNTEVVLTFNLSITLRGVQGKSTLWLIN